MQHLTFKGNSCNVDTASLSEQVSSLESYAVSSTEIAWVLTMAGGCPMVYLQVPDKRAERVGAVENITQGKKKFPQPACGQTVFLTFLCFC